jgi:hypothetical protein
MQKKTLDDVSSRSSQFKQHSKDAVGVLEEEPYAQKTLDDVSSRSSRFKQHSKDAIGVLLKHDATIDWYTVHNNRER